MTPKPQNNFLHIIAHWFSQLLDKLWLWIICKFFGLGLAIMLSYPKAKRMSHNNGIAGRGKVKIVDNPEFPPHDFFEPGKVFAARVRHASATFYDDAMNCIRSISVKFSDNDFESPFDLEMNSGEISLFWSTASFLQFAKLRKEQWGIEYEEYYKKYPAGLKGAQLSLRRDPSSYHNLHYYAKTPFLFVGRDAIKRYAKYRVKPFEDEPETGINPNPSEWDTCNQRILPHETRGRNYLKDEYMQRVKREGAKYRLQMQLRKANDDDSPEVFNNMVVWDEKLYPWQDLAEIEITQILSWHESLRTSFSMNNMPENLTWIPAKSIYDYNSLNYMRAHSEIARKARIVSYKVFGYPPEIPDDDNRNSDEWDSAK